MLFSRHMDAGDCGPVQDPKAHLLNRELRFGSRLVCQSQVVADKKVSDFPFVGINEGAIDIK
jgi:hypothetical protein